MATDQHTNGYSNGGGHHVNGGGPPSPVDEDDQIPYIALRLDTNGPNLETSALALVTALRPEWADAASPPVEFVRFTEGITNTLLKAVRKVPGQSKEEVDASAVLLRAYGSGTDLIIDRHRETQNHELLSRHGLAPQLLARFDNGIMYRFIAGSVTQPADLRRPDVYRAVASRLAEWHAVMPCLPERRRPRSCDARTPEERRRLLRKESIDSVAPSKPAPNVWTVMQKWIYALPTETDQERARQEELQTELARLVDELSERDSLGKNGLVFAHCDLLSGNVIILPNASKAANGGRADSKEGEQEEVVVSFIDYEYATPSPAAFDISNHFAEWGGFDCDYSVLPTRKQRREFLQAYVRSYYRLFPSSLPAAVEDGVGEDGVGEDGAATVHAAVDEATEVDRLMDEVDLFRGVPGFYWGIWSLIQAMISDLDFDYASYADTRLGEYWAWRAEQDGSRAKKGVETPLREIRWAAEE